MTPNPLRSLLAIVAVLTASAAFAQAVPHEIQNLGERELATMCAVYTAKTAMELVEALPPEPSEPTQRSLKSNLALAAYWTSRPSALDEPGGTKKAEAKFEKLSDEAKMHLMSRCPEKAIEGLKTMSQEDKVRIANSASQMLAEALAQNRQARKKKN